MGNLDLSKSILIGAALIAGAILLSGGVYDFAATGAGGFRFNRWTGEVVVCGSRACKPLELKQTLR